MVTQSGRRAGSLVGHGLLASLVGGTVFALAVILGAALIGSPWHLPVRMFASLLLGDDALTAAVPLGEAVLVGLFAHFGVMLLWGVLYGAFMALVPQRWRSGLVAEAVVGALFGTFVWFVDFGIVAAGLYPWLLETSVVAQWLLHAVFFGVPVGLTFGFLERTQPSSRYIEA